MKERMPFMKYYWITCMYNFTIEENVKLCEQNMEINVIIEKIVEEEEEKEKGKEDEKEEEIKIEKIYISDEFTKEEEFKKEKDLTKRKRRYN